MKMKTLVTVVLSLICLNSNAQDWAPFKRTDTLVNYVSIDSITTNYNYVDTVGHLRYFHPIQSISVDSVLLDSSNYKSIVFKKGVSANDLLNDYYPRPQLLKGQILGDSAIIKKDYSHFSSIDSLGFNIRFEHRIKQGINWQLGNSVDYILKANCDTLYWGSIDSLLSDSLALISIQVEDTNANILNNHILNNSKIILSKKNGLIRTVSFTNIDTIRYYTLYRGLDKPIMLTDHLDFKKGDEVHIIEGVKQTVAPGGWVDSTNRYIVTIKDDSSSSTHQCLKTDHGRWFLDQPGSIKISNSDWWCVDKLKVLALNESMLYQNGNIPFTYYSTNCLGVSYSSGFNNLVIYPSVWVNQYDTSGKPTNLISELGYYNRRLNQYLVGAGIEFYELFGFTGGYNEKAHKVQYVKKGNKSWGIPHLTTYIADNETTAFEELIIAPNPTEGRLHIKLPRSEDILKISLFSIKGTQIEVHCSGNEIDLSALPKGMYILNIQTKQNSWVKKVLKR